jgi:hypothetical protein
MQELPAAARATSRRYLELQIHPCEAAETTALPGNGAPDLLIKDLVENGDNCWLVG